VGGYVRMNDLIEKKTKKDPYLNVSDFQLIQKIDKVISDCNWIKSVIQHKHFISDGSETKDKLLHYLREWADKPVVKSHDGLLSYSKEYPNMVDHFCKELKTRYKINICNYDLLKFIEVDMDGKKDA